MIFTRIWLLKLWFKSFYSSGLKL